MFSTPVVARPWGVHFFRSTFGDAGSPSLELESEPDEEVVMRVLNQRFRQGSCRDDKPTTAVITKDGEIISRYWVIDEHRVDKMPHLGLVPGFKVIIRTFD